MFRLVRLLTAALAFTLLAANNASAITASLVEKPASGLFGLLEQRVGIDALASAGRIDEKLSLFYDFASDFSVAARATAGAVKEGTTVYRVFGGEARGLGRSWTTVNPGNVENYRKAAGLFPENSGQFVIEGRLTNTEGVLFRDALPGPNGVGGGLPEVVIPNPGSQVCVLGVCGVNPAF